MLKLRNTLTRKVEAFAPAQGNRVRMYACGPTVYDFGHIGNFRTFVAVDVLRRYLSYIGYDVTYVMNITDVDDKIIRGLHDTGKTLAEYTQFYNDRFLDDLGSLNIRKPDFMPRATDHIPDMIDLTQRLRDQGHTYQSDGSVYFRISSFPGYGKLSGSKIEGNRAGARVDSDEYDKADARDFVLWKAPRDEREPSWPSPFGPGRPGWHLECSAMSMKYLGESFDIHCGGVDLLFPHHENEIAQSEGATGKPFVKTWFHVEFLLVEGEKMSKRRGNFYTLRDLADRGYSPGAIRYLLLSVPYSTQLNFTLEELRAREHSLERLRNFRERVRLASLPDGSSPVGQAAVAAARESFESALGDDLNTSAALAAVFELVREVNTALDSGRLGGDDRAAVLDFLDAADSVLGLLGAAPETIIAPDLQAEIAALIDQRNAARRDRDFARADSIRNKLSGQGVIIEDTPSGTRWKLK